MVSKKRARFEISIQWKNKCAKRTLLISSYVFEIK